MAVMVSGGTGFMGINVVRDLAEHGHEVVAIDVGPPDDLTRRFLAPWQNKVTWVVGDLLDVDLLQKVGRENEVDVIVHAAAYTPYDEQEKTHFAYTMENNVSSLLRLLEFASTQGVKRFLFVSTMAVYVPDYTELLPEEARWTPAESVVFTEDSPLTAGHVYGISKIASEKLLRRYGALFDIETVSVRLAQNWGTMERVTPFHARMSIPYYWSRQAARGEPIEVSPFGEGVTKSRILNQDHVYALDTAAAIRALITASRLKYSEYNISGGSPVFADDMVAAMREAWPEARFVEPIVSDNASTRPSIAIDSSRLHEEVGFSTQYSLPQALRHCILWRLENEFLD